jgi:hypothetical protein
MSTSEPKTTTLSNMSVSFRFDETKP